MALSMYILHTKAEIIYVISIVLFSTDGKQLLMFFMHGSYLHTYIHTNTHIHGNSMLLVMHFLWIKMSYLGDKGDGVIAYTRILDKI